MKELIVLVVRVMARYNTPLPYRLCPDCNGTGRDEAKTKDMRKRGLIDAPAYVRCWTCNGNGVEP